MSYAPPAAERVSGNRDLVELILIRLPAKSLARFKAVDKQWLSLISDRQFVHSHCRRRPNNLATGMFLHQPLHVFIPFTALDPTYQTIPSLDFLHVFMFQLLVEEKQARDDDDARAIAARAKIHQSCNGLLLCAFGGSSYHLVVVNPTTKCFRLLPKVPYWEAPILSLYLAFDPFVSLHYKVVCVESLCPSDDGDGNGNGGNETSRFHVYSSDDDDPCWKTYEYSFDSYDKDGYSWNDFIYYVDHHHPHFFNINTAELKPMMSLYQNIGEYVYTCLPVVGGRLFCASNADDRKAGFCLLEMSKDFSKCIAKYDVIKLGSNISDEMVNEYRALCVVFGEEEEVAAVVLNISEKLVLYNLKERTAKELYTLEGEQRYIPRWGQTARQFVETLAYV